MKYPVFKDLIIFENDDYILINKPPFLATLEDRALHTTNVLKLARQYHPDVQACHRLDKENSQRHIAGVDLAAFVLRGKLDG